MKLGYRTGRPKSPPADAMEAATPLLPKEGTAAENDRRREGMAPLPTGHRITWGAISQERCPLELLNGK